MAGAVAPLRSFLFPLLVILPFLLLASRSTHSRPLLTKTNESTALLSDGLKPGVLGSEQLLRLDGKSNFFSSAEETCEQTYGVLPCTTTAVGNLFLLLAYGYLMFLAATYLSNGSEMLLVMLGPGIVGGLFLPMLGALPDAILILVSGLSGSRETAQQQVLIGMGLLAGSTVMLLTLLWGSCVVVGKCDLSDTSTLIDSQDTRRFTLQGSGIITDVQTSYAARIMVISIIPFIIMQLPKIFKMSSGHRLIIMVALVVSVGLLLSYCLYQVFQPWVLKRRLAYARHKLVKSGILKHVQALGRLLTDDGLPDSSFIKKLFYNIDADNDGVITRTELKALIIGIKFDNIDFDRDDAVEEVMKDFDTSNNNQIDEDEFRNGISRWLLDAKLPSSHSDQFRDYHSRAREEYDSLIEMNDEVVEKVDNPSWVTFKAVLLLLLGTMIAILSADPLVDAVDNFSSATSIPSFFISFIAMPLATNSSEAVSALIFASRKKKRTSSLTFSEIYGAVTMNNTLCLAVFLALVYVRQLTWDFSSEVLIILLVCVVMGLFASFRTNFPLWTACVAYLLYPVSLMLVYILDYIFGWS